VIGTAILPTRSILRIPLEHLKGVSRDDHACVISPEQRENTLEVPGNATGRMTMRGWE
jgi:hypothetical protein